MTASSPSSSTPARSRIPRPQEPVATASSFASPDVTRALEQEDRIDSYIANALNALSLQERNAVYHELHGVSEEVEETPTFMKQKFLEFESEWTHRCKSLASDAAIRIAMSLSPDLIHDTKFRLMFLRSENFRVPKAVHRMIQFFEVKLYLFGRDRLVKNITLDDLDRNDRDSLDSGFLQLLPIRDRAGRAILVLMLQHQTYKVPENMTRALFYICMAGLEDEATQRKGFTVIVYNVGDFNPRNTDLRTVSQGGWLICAMPTKTCSLHHCFSDPKVRSIINFSMRFFSNDTRAKCKVHFGTGLECVYALMTYGIPPDILPVNTADGIEIKRKNHVKWLRMRKEQEASSHIEDVHTRIVVPANIDILFGRGKVYREHLGNLKMVDILEKNLARYESAGLKEKSAVISEVTQEIKNQGARFVKMESYTWKEVDDKLAKEKVSHGFRTRLRMNGGCRSNVNTNKASTRDVECITTADTDPVEAKRARVAS